MKKLALITGVSGQDGAYLAKFLLDKKYRIVGTDRRSARSSNWRLKRLGIENKIIFEEMELSELYEIQRIFKKYKFDEVYHLAAQSFVKTSFNSPLNTSNITGLGTQFTIKTNSVGVLNMLEAFRKFSPNGRFYQASSSEMFGVSVDKDKFQRETTELAPNSPYGCSKVFSFYLTKFYRRAYKLFVCNGILFNHESPFRGTNFVTNKIVKGAVSIKLGIQKKLELGNLDAYRDWGHSKDYVDAMHKIINHKVPDDFVVASGKTYSVRDFCKITFDKLNLNYKNYVVQNKKYFRPGEVPFLKGDARRARKILKWKPKYTIYTLIDEMIESWTKTLKK